MPAYVDINAGLAACVSNAQGLLGSSDPDYKQETSEKAPLREGAKQAALERKRGKAKAGRTGQEVTASNSQVLVCILLCRDA